jgi:transposase-like protein
MAEQFTHEQIQNYMADNAETCPRCGNSDISTKGPITADGRTAWQKVECSVCNTEWKDIYQLIDIEKS